MFVEEWLLCRKATSTDIRERARGLSDQPELCSIVGCSRTAVWITAGFLRKPVGPTSQQLIVSSRLVVAVALCGGQTQWWLSGRVECNRSACLRQYVMAYSVVLPVPARSSLDSVVELCSCYPI